MAKFNSADDNNEVKVWNESISSEVIDEWVKSIQDKVEGSPALVIYLQHGPKPYAAKIAVQIGEGLNSKNVELARFTKARDAITTFATYAVMNGVVDVNLRDKDGNIFTSFLKK